MLSGVDESIVEVGGAGGHVELGCSDVRSDSEEDTHRVEHAGI